MESRLRYKQLTYFLALTLAAMLAQAQYNPNAKKTASSSSSSSGSSSSSAHSSGSYGSSSSSSSSQPSTSGGSSSRPSNGGTTYSGPSSQNGSSSDAGPSTATTTSRPAQQTSSNSGRSSSVGAANSSHSTAANNSISRSSASSTAQVSPQVTQANKQAARQAKEQAKEAARNGPKPVDTTAQPSANVGASSGVRTPSTASASIPTTSMGRAPLAYAPPTAGAVKKTLGDEMILNKDGGKSVVQQVNASRQRMSGINAKPIPEGKVSLQSNGVVQVEASGGKQYTLLPDGTLASYAAKGQKASFHPNGTLSMLHSGNLLVNRSANGARRIEISRPDKSVLVSTGPGRGYLQRTLTRNNTTFVQRTYAVNNVTYTRIYTTYVYRNVVLEHYVPRVYYAPAFYSWAYDPWATPVRFYWGFYGAPWYAYYGPYFTPYPVYAGTSLWLTDYVLANALESAYAEREANAVVQSSEEGDTPISAEVKQAINEEVQQQIAAENAAAADPQQVTTAGDLPDELKRPKSTFIVSSALDLSSSDGECELTSGDVIQTEGPQPTDIPTVTVLVVSAKRTDCRAASLVTVSLNDLQEMQNNLREQVDAGLGVLRAGQGANGLPEAPAGVIAPPPILSAAAPLPGNNENVAGLLRQETDQADQAETQLLQNAFGGEVKQIAD